MPIQIASNIVPKNSQTFYMVEDVFIKGGFQIQDNIAGRDAIAFGNLKLGQLVLTTDTGIIWKLTSLAGPTIAAPDTPQVIEWTQLSLGGIEEAPQDGNVYGRSNGAWTEVTSSGGNGNTRLVSVTNISSLDSGSTQDAVLDIGPSCLVFKLTVSRVCKITIYGTPAKDEPNPYTFLATDTHLTDDGSMLLTDGSVFRTRNFSILANMEATVLSSLYMQVDSVDDASGPIVVTITYYPLEVGPPVIPPPVN